MKTKLEAFKSVLDNSGTLTKADKAYIRRVYKETIKVDLVISSGCQNCWMDAIIILLASLRDNKIFMSAGLVVEFEGATYTRKNITDSVALKIMNERPELKMYFKIY